MSAPWQQVAEYGGVPVLVHDSIQVFDDRAADTIVVTGSHMGGPASLFGASTGAIGVIGNDAGGGRESAGTAGLEALEPYRVAAAAVGHESARIGDGTDTYKNGVITRVNRWALEVGVAPGMPVRRATELMVGWKPGERKLPAADEGHNTVIYREESPRVLAVDSASQIGDGLAADIVLTGSHGGAVGGKPLRALVAAAFFNDAGVGKDGAGLSRLPLLGQMGIPGVTVSSASAGIGHGAETYELGVVSHVNDTAGSLGVEPGMTAREATAVLVTALMGD